MLPSVELNEEMITVVIVEDEVEVGEILKYNLEAKGMEVYHAVKGMEGCSLIAENQPDVIVLDLLLPDIDGREVCKLLRQHDDPLISSTPILMLTALGEAVNREAGLAMGADDYMLKPFSIKEVILRVFKLAEKRKNQKELVQTRVNIAQREERENELLHEVRNKLIAVEGFGKRLAAKADELTKAEVKGFARHIVNSAGYLTSLSEKNKELNDLDECPNLIDRDIEIGKKVKAIVGHYTPVAQRKGLKLEFLPVDKELYCAILEGQLTLMLSNLLENAIKYCPIMSTVTVSVHEDGDGLLICVSDDGPGIAYSEQESIFLKGVRGSGIDSNHEPGSGIGLHLIKKTAERVGGSISLESTVGKGSTFKLRLPGVK